MINLNQSEDNAKWIDSMKQQCNSLTKFKIAQNAIEEKARKQALRQKNS
jgi:hypothetical protein